MTIDELEKAASSLGYELVQRTKRPYQEHEDGEKRWVFTSELDKVKIQGDPDAYITLLDDLLDKDTKITWRKYTIIFYSQIKFIPRIIEAAKERSKILRSKRSRCMEHKKLEELVRKFPDVFRDSGAVPVPEFEVEKPDGYTKEYVSKVLDGVNKRNALDWCFAV